MVVDVHTHIGTGLGEASADDLLRMLDQQNVDSAVAFPGPSGLAGSPRQIAQANLYVADAARQHPDRFTAFGTVNPWHAEEAGAELERFPELGLKGLKLHPPIQGFVISDRKLLDPILLRCAQLRLRVIVHAGLRVGGLPYVMVSLEDLKTLALAHESVRFVVAHAGWGGRDARGADDLARSCANVWFDTSGVNMPAQIVSLVQGGAAERVMFGSDFPFLHPTVERLRLDLAELDDALQARVLSANARTWLEDQ
jgi:predicted TIM-barrel fold metal-dependent hydrolase